jgi:hypothetical protein
MLQSTRLVGTAEIQLFSACCIGTHSVPISNSTTILLQILWRAIYSWMRVASVHPFGTTAVLPTWKDLISSAPDDNVFPCLRRVLLFVRTSQSKTLLQPLIRLINTLLCAIVSSRQYGIMLPLLSRTCWVSLGSSSSQLPSRTTR